MKVGEYFISWRHTWNPVSSHNKRAQMVTMCTLYKDKEVKHHVHVGNHQNDQPSREAGRKASLTRLLKQISEIEPKAFDRKFRAEVWETYRTLTKEPRWKLKTFREYARKN